MRRWKSILDKQSWSRAIEIAVASQTKSAQPQTEQFGLSLIQNPKSKI